MPFLSDVSKPILPEEEKRGAWGSAVELGTAAREKMTGDIARTGELGAANAGWKSISEAFGAVGKLASMREKQARAKVDPETVEAVSSVGGLLKSPGRAFLGHAAQSATEMATTIGAGAIGSTFGPAGTAAGLFAAGAGSSATRMIGETSSVINGASVSDLIQGSKSFARDMASGMSAEKAKLRLINKTVSDSDILPASTIYGLLNAIPGFGVEARAIAAATKPAVRGGLRSFGKEVLKTGFEGGAQEAGQEAVENIVGQQAQVSLGAQDKVDPLQVAKAAGSGAIIGGFLEAGLGVGPAAISARPEFKRKAPPASVVDPAQAAAIQASASANTPATSQKPSVDTLAQTAVTQAPVNAAKLQATVTAKQAAAQRAARAGVVPPSPPPAPPAGPAPAAPAAAAGPLPEQVTQTAEAPMPPVAPAAVTPAPVPVTPPVTPVAEAAAPVPVKRQTEDEFFAEGEALPLVSPPSAGTQKKQAKARAKKIKPDIPASRPSMSDQIAALGAEREAAVEAGMKAAEAPAPVAEAPPKVEAPAPKVEEVKAEAPAPKVETPAPKAEAPVKEQPAFVEPKPKGPPQVLQRVTGKKTTVEQSTDEILAQREVKAKRAQHVAALSTKQHELGTGKKKDRLAKYERLVATQNTPRAEKAKEIIAARAEAANKGDAIKLNKRLIGLMEEETTERKAAKAKLEEERVQEKAKVEAETTPAQKVGDIAREFSPHPRETLQRLAPRVRAAQFLTRLRVIGKALDAAKIPKFSTPFEIGVRNLRERVAKNEHKVTDRDIKDFNDMQSKAAEAVATKPEKAIDVEKEKLAEVAEGKEDTSSEATRLAEAEDVSAEEALDVGPATEEETEQETAAKVSKAELSSEGMTSRGEVTEDQRSSEMIDARIGKESLARGPARMDAAVEKVTDKEGKAYERSKAASEARQLSPEEKQAVIADLKRRRLMAPAFSGKRKKALSDQMDRDISVLRPTGQRQVKTDSGRTITVNPIGVTTVKEIFDVSSIKDAVRKYLIGSNVQQATTETMEEIVRQVQARVGDIQVFVYDHETVDEIMDRVNTPGFYNLDTDEISVSADLIGTPDLARITLHEAVHAAFAHHIEASPKAKEAVTTLYEFVKNHGVSSDPILNYALTNIHEFISEALSNPQVQALLSRIRLPASIASDLGVPRAKQRSVLSHLFGLIAKAMGVPHTTVFDGVLTVTSKLLEHRYPLHSVYDIRKMPSRALPSSYLGAPPTQGAPKQGGSWWHAPDWMTKARGAWLKGRQFDQLARDADAYFGGEKNNPLRAVADGPERRRVISQKYIDEGNEVIREAMELVRAAGAEGEAFLKLGQDTTIANVHPDVPLTDVKNAFLGKRVLKTHQTKARHADLHARWQALSPEFKRLWHKVSKFTTDRQNDMTLRVLENIVERATGTRNDALASRIFNDAATDADWDLFNTNTALKAINNALALKRIDGFYMPLTREGEWVVRGTYDLSKEDLKGGTVIGDDVVQFIAPSGRGGKARLRENVEAYVAGSEFKPLSFKRVFVDPNDNSKIVPNEDPNGVAAVRVQMQTQHMEMTDTSEQADAATEELRKSGMMKNVKGAERARLPAGGERPDMLSTTFDDIANKIVQNRGEGALSGPLAAALREISIRTLGATRVQSRRLPRRYVKGYSEDAIHSLSTYNISSAGYLGKLETQPGIDKALADAKKYMEDHSDQPSAKTIPRSQFYNEAEERIRNLNSRVEAPIDTKVNNILSLSQMDKLASASYHIINALQNVTVTIPVLAGRHGARNVAREMSKAYALVGVKQTVWAGLRDSARAGKSEAGNAARYLGLTGKPGTGANLPVKVTDYIGDLRKKLAAAPNGADLLRLMDELNILITPDASFEIGMLTGTRHALTTSINRASFVFRQVGQAVETINRSTAAIAAYNLELQRNGGDSDAAVRYAKNILQMTHFNYSQTNAPPIMSDRHPIMRLALQFKKYAQNMVYLMVKLGHTALSKETDPVARREAAKALVYVLGTTAAMSGVLGLPTEPFRIGVMLMGALNLTDLEWRDVERWVEDNFGTSIAHGFPNLMGVDLSTRMGLNNMLLFGEPGGEARKDRDAWMWQLISGAPGSYGGDVVDGMGKLGQAANSYLSGNYMQGGRDLMDFTEKVVPIRSYSDMIGAYRLATEGKINKHGDVVTEPGFGAAAMKLLGFQSTRQAEDRRIAGNLYKDTSRRDAARQEFFDRWKLAKTAAERQEIFDDVKSFNRSLPERAKKARVTWKALNRAAKTAKKAIKYKGVYLGNRNADFAPQ